MTASPDAAPIVRVRDATLVPDGGPGSFVVSQLAEVEQVAARAASAAMSVHVDGAGRLHALLTPSQLVNAAGRVDPELGGALEVEVLPAVAAWLAAPADLVLPRPWTALRAADRPVVMGICNVTPDSFSDGGLAYGSGEHPEIALAHARRLVAAGADLVDVGGESTRPGAQPVPAAEELERVVPVVEALAADGVVVSIDTTKAEVARAAVAAGAAVVNDVSAGALDPDLQPTVAEVGAAYVLMHMQGTPRTMQAHPSYDDVVAEVHDHLANGVRAAVRHGIDRATIAVDPGIGFGKTVAHNLTLLASVRQFTSLGRPVAVGTSRKSFIGSVGGGADDPADRLAGSLATAVTSVAAGASVVRVHDVAETRQAVDLAAAVRRGHPDG